MGDIHFMGGIHGVGKSTICGKVCEKTGLVHLTASQLLKWNEISAIDNKKVADIQNMQDRLITGLNSATKANESYLFNANTRVEKVPLDTFVKIAPKSIAVVVAEVEIIKQRLERRDNKVYQLDLLELMQNTEREYAKTIARELNVPFTEIEYDDYGKFIESISNTR